MRKVRPPDALRGEIWVTGDKSISHRAVILNGIARGRAKVTGFAHSRDCLATLECLHRLGVDINVGPHREIIMAGSGERGLAEPADVLDALNSATCMRLLTGLLAGQTFLSVMTGDASLRSRPMDRVVEPLRLMGAQIWGRDQDSRAPLAIRGSALHGIEYELPVASAQVKSALLLAGLFAQGETVVVEPLRSRDHTERMLDAMGASIRVIDRAIRLTAGPLRAVDVAVPGDISSAAFWLVAGAVHPDARVRLPDVGVNPTRSGVIEVLTSMGARLRAENERTVCGEPFADLVIESSALTGTTIGGDLIPRVIDELPVLALAACLARGQTLIKDAQELRVKESDRISATATELRKLGAAVSETPDGMVIEGGRILEGTVCESHGDHRLAMMLAVAGLVAGGETTIDNADVADVSYSGFWRDMELLAGGRV